MNSFQLKTFPEDCLRVMSRDVTDFGANLDRTVKDMAEIMYISKGIGLAAPQVGLNIRLLVVDIGEGLKAFINPEIIYFSGEIDTMEEGCLSLPDISVTISRSEHIELKSMKSDGSPIANKYTGLMAKVLQHEIDHLNGKLLIDYLNPFSRSMAKRKLKKIKLNKIPGIDSTSVNRL